MELNEFSIHLKLELDIKTNSQNVEKALHIISKTINEKLNDGIPDTIEIVSTITVLQIDDSKPVKYCSCCDTKHQLDNCPHCYCILYTDEPKIIRNKETNNK